jgi:hypothetical protein
MMTQGFHTSHLDGPKLDKLSQLRRKTDQQLLKLIQSKLDVGLSFAVLAEVELSVGDPAYAERSVEQADQALAEVQKLLPALNEDHRRIVDPKLNDLREAVDRLSRNREFSRTQTASMS